MNWRQVLEDKSLRDLPYKIELNRWGEIVMSPARSRHSNLQGEIQHLLRGLKPAGRVFPECPIETSDNVKVADVVWLSRERYEKLKDEDVYSMAPEICVEALSGSNTDAEMMQKRGLYFERGCIEFWLCGDDGAMRFFDQTGQLAASKLVPDFPARVQI